MIPNHSPWIKQLKRTRPVVPLEENIKTDVAIVGGGIAGVATAYFTLRDSDKNVVLLEADKIAHGATGHNAGLLTTYFERPLSLLVDEFGFKLAIEGQKSIEFAWILLDEIFQEAGLRSPLYRFTGYDGISTLEQLLASLKDNMYRMRGGLPVEAILVARESGFAAHIPEEYINLYSIIPQSDLLAMLETNNTTYSALVSCQKGCLNSALFTEELIGYLIAKHRGRFSFFEGSPVSTVTLKEDSGALQVFKHTVEANRIVLCTNGFENFSIINNAGVEINTRFHHLINGRIGYMAGYIEPLNSSPVSISYFPKKNNQTGDPTGEPYFLLTRRPDEHASRNAQNLVCAGGPEKVLPNQATYSRDDACSEEARLSIDEFLRDNYRHYPDNDAKYVFCWHGLMGYTPNGVRRVGPEPCNPVLLYNLGCNGVGLLPSIFGGKRISEFLRGIDVPPSIFHPLDQSCGI